MKRAMTEVIVRRGFHAIRRDPKRALRNLVDLGQETAGGQFQRKFLGMAQQVLTHEDSPYYTLIQKTIQSVDEERLLTFGMNLGWNGLVQGAKQIRTEEARRGHNIPWSLTFHIEAGPDSLSAKEYLCLIREGTELGVYTYFLFPRDSPSVQFSIDLCQSNRGCAFCIMLPPGLEEQRRNELCPNTILGVDTSGEDWMEQVQWLRDGKYPYLLYRTYSTPEDVEDIISGRWAERIMPQAGVAALLVAAGDTAFPKGSPVYEYALDARLKQRYPTVMLDFYHDNIYADRCISGAPCFFGVLPDGIVTEYCLGREKPTIYSVRTQPLEELFRRFSRSGQFET